jgi:hypothetical protein
VCLCSSDKSANCCPSQQQIGPHQTREGPPQQGEGLEDPVQSHVQDREARSVDPPLGPCLDSPSHHPSSAWHPLGSPPSVLLPELLMYTLVAVPFARFSSLGHLTVSASVYRTSCWRPWAPTTSLYLPQCSTMCFQERVAGSFVSALSSWSSSSQNYSFAR